jgi:hypothetical protein
VSLLRDNLCKLKQIYILPKYQGNGYAQQAIIMIELLYPEAKHWELDESPVMNIDEQEAEHFDESLEKMDKKFQPSQEEFYILSHSIIL